MRLSLIHQRLKNKMESLGWKEMCEAGKDYPRCGLPVAHSRAQPPSKETSIFFFFFESPLLNINQAHRPISALGLQFFTSDLVKPLHFTDESEGTKVKSLL